MAATNDEESRDPTKHEKRGTGRFGNCVGFNFKIVETKVGILTSSAGGTAVQGGKILLGDIVSNIAVNHLSRTTPAGGR
jgi:hypothetical protein